jgi:diguanylate cyclase (GGDEF)-like protein
MPGSLAASPPPHDRTLVSAIWPQLLVMALMLILSLLSVLVVSGLRAYTYGQDRWSIGEDQAVEQLRRYAVDGDEATYRRVQESLAVPLGDRVARLQLQRPHPDYALARHGLIAGGNAPADVTGMIVIFRLFDRLPVMAHAVAVWGVADTFIAAEQDNAQLLHAQFAGGHPDRQQLRALLARVDDLHQRVVPVAQEFGATIGTASRQIGRLLLLVLPLGSALLLLAGVSRSRAQFRRDERMARALRDLASSLRHQATHDSLTNLTNRAEFEVRLEIAIAERVRAASHWWLLYFDLDQFKVINDTCGHAAGDELIQKVSWLLRARLQPDDVLARLGGDEFGVLLPRRTGEAALALADDIRQQISGLRFQFTDRMFSVSASFGMLGLDATVPSVGDALSRADQACYLAKDNGRNRVQIYHPDDQQVQVRHGEMQWVERLNAALDEDRFAVVAQEIRRVGAKLERGGTPLAQRFEMLLRLVGPGGEQIAPMAFIPAAERYGLMPRVDRWVIARVCRELAQLRSRGGTLPTCMVNLSGTSVCDPGLADFIAECLSHSGLGAMHLGFELTETAAVANLTQASQLMARLRAMGCPIALDDFGSGMSSFAYLRNLPIDFLKIDGSFIRKIDTDPIDFAMVETIHRIGGIMGMQTVAESVENEHVLAALTLIGVDFAQGFHIRPPVPLEQLRLTALPPAPRRQDPQPLKAVVGPRGTR